MNRTIISISINTHSKLASGSGDKTVRFWDLATQTPEFTSTGEQIDERLTQMPTPFPPKATSTGSSALPGLPMGSRWPRAGVTMM